MSLLPENFAPGGTPCADDPERWVQPGAHSAAAAAADECMDCPALEACTLDTQAHPPVGYVVQAGRIWGRGPGISDRHIREHLARLWESGWTAPALADELGVSIDAVYKWHAPGSRVLPRQDLRPALLQVQPIPSRSLEDAAGRIVAMHDAGWSREDMMAATGVRHAALSRIEQMAGGSRASIDAVLAVPAPAPAPVPVWHQNCRICRGRR